MNLFWKRIFGHLISTDKLEKQEATLLANFERYKEIAHTLELAEYNDLNAIVNSAEFKANKKTLQNVRYKETEAYRNWHKFQKLDKNRDLKAYFELLTSPKLHAFLAFKETKEYILLSSKHEVGKSEQLQEMKHFERSAEYKIYLRFHNSFIVEEYTKLKAIVHTDEFRLNNAFWSNPKRWRTTKEFEMSERYFALLKNPDIQYFINTDPTQFNEINRLESSFSEHFDGYTLDATRWQFGFHYGSEELVGLHSFVNEKQANNGGKNTSVVDGVLHIETRKEAVRAKAWDKKKGFALHQFEATSDVLQCGEHFAQQYGVFRAKIRCKGHIHHAFWLKGRGQLPHINIFHFDGKEIKVGNATSNGFDEEVITGINPNHYYIYSLHWTPKELIWYINNMEVHRVSTHIPAEPLYLGFNSFITANQTIASGKMEVDWIEVYKV